MSADVFKFDTHIHTDESSPCGHVTAKHTVELYRQAGYSGICITDHFGEYGFGGVTDKRQRVERFLKGYRAARDYAAGTDFVVMLGAEITFSGSCNDYLIFGLTEDFLLLYPDVCQMKFSNFFALAKQNGFAIFQAHPFRNYMTRQNPEFLDGIEIVNGNCRQNSYNHLAKAFAQEQGLAVSGGSDCHELEDIGRSGIITASKIKTAADLIKHLTDRSAQVIEPQNA